jgi:hypothetical protein
MALSQCFVWKRRFNRIRAVAFLLQPQQGSVRNQVCRPQERYYGPSYFTAGAILFVCNVYQTYACLWTYIPFRTRGSYYGVDVS